LGCPVNFPLNQSIDIRISSLSLTFCQWQKNAVWITG
jgi:hypothetical protein